MARRSLWSFFFAAIIALASITPVQANGFQPDNLDGPCCGPTNVNIPQLPVQTLQTKYVCWNNCSPGLSGTVLTTFQPAQVACGIYINRMTVTNLSGALTAWTGRLVMQYTRTWAEASVPGATPDTQVWRFILNGDLQPSQQVINQFGGNACIVAPCVTQYNSFHVDGYIDYALNCNTGQMSIAFAVDHDCDTFEHANAFTCRPGNFHPTRSYSFIGPAAGFVCDVNVPTAQGPINCEAFRNNDFTQPLAAICQFEQPIQGGGIGNQGTFCPCSPNAPGQYSIQQFDAGTICMSVANSTQVDVWPGLVGKSLGFWTDPTVYPGTERLHIERGHTSYTDGCTGVQTRPYFIGAQTQGGFPTFKLDPTGALVPVSSQLIDLGDATFLNQNSQPRIGKLSISDKMIYLNVN